MSNQSESDEQFNALVQRIRKYIPEWAYLNDIDLLCKQQKRLMEFSNLPATELGDSEKQQLLDLPLLNEFLQ